MQISELSLTKPEQVEEAKKIFESLETTISIKNKEPKIFERTLVILTCNQVPWKFYGEEQQAFQNRMFGFLNLHSTTILNNLKSPKFFGGVFSYNCDEICSEF